MRTRGALLGFAVVASLLGMTLPASAQTTSFGASFKETFGRAASKPCDHFLCGTGTVQGYGAATSTWDPSSVAPIEGTNCAIFAADRTITLVHETGTLSLSDQGTVCFPGKSAEAAGTLHSFGNPFNATATYNVSGGTGVFTGAGGSGSDHVAAAGDGGHSNLTGILTL